MNVELKPDHDAPLTLTVHRVHRRFIEELATLLESDVNSHRPGSPDVKMFFSDLAANLREKLG